MTNNSENLSRPDTRFFFLITLITLAGLGLRLWKIGHGLPYAYYWDEGTAAGIALDLKTVHFNPNSYPHLFYYLYFLCDVAYVLYGLATGFFKTAADAWLLYKEDPSVFFIIGRSLSAVLGTLTIPLVYLCGKKAFNRETGAVASLFLAFSFLHVQWSQIAYRDAALTFFIVAAFFFALLALERGQTMYFTLSGLLSGFATSTKYQAVLTIFWGPLASALIASQAEKSQKRALLNPLTVSFLIFFFLGFTLGTPYWILDFTRFSGRLFIVYSFLSGYGSAGYLGREGDWNWSYYLNGPLHYGLGLPLLIVSLLGILRLFSSRRPSEILILFYPLFYFLIIGVAHKQRSSYALPMIPFLCISGACFLEQTISAYLRRNTKKYARVLALVSFVTLLPGAFSIGRFLYLRSFPDTREVAREWLDKNIPPESKVFTTDYFSYCSGEPKFNCLDDLDRIHNRSVLRSLEEYRKQGADYFILDDWHLGIVFVEGAKHAKYEPLINRYQHFLNELDRSASLLVSFSPYREKVAFDRDNMMMPSRSLWKMKSLGPGLRVYRWRQ